MSVLIAVLLLQSAPAIDERRLYADCARAAEAGVPGAIDAASQWVAGNGGLAARHCLGLAYLGANKPGEASAAFEAAARVAEASGSPTAADLYGQAGNAALIADNAPRAETLLSAAIVLAARHDGLRAALLIDRARARSDQANPAGTRGDLEAAIKLAPNDAAGWLLLGALARREARLADARVAVAKAISLAPGDPDIQLEAGNIAAMDGDFARARALWTAAVVHAPGTPAAKAAADALLRNPE